MKANSAHPVTTIDKTMDKPAQLDKSVRFNQLCKSARFPHW
ncbi:hypothetical protein [Sansalvadorimonas verongulae]|nr:hypothetical protein [Sansalvadorimonas verongulae]